MRRAILFLPRFTVGLWVALFVAFVSLLLLNAPSVPSRAPFAGVSIRANNSPIIQLPNRIFTCTETGQQFLCQAKIQNRSLALSLTKGKSDYRYDFIHCRAVYDGRSVGCREVGQTYAPILAELYELTDLELNPGQLRAIQQEYWGINLLIQLGELRLNLISLGLSLTAGVGAAFFAYFYPGNLSKTFTSLACGLGLSHLVLSLLGRVPYDAVTSYGFTPDTWGWFVNGGAIASGIGTIFGTALLLWRRLNRFTKILLSISSSAGIFNLCSLSLLYVLTYLPSALGLTRTFLPFLQNGSLLMGISTAISAVVAIASAILLWVYTNQSIQSFLCLSSGFGSSALSMYFLQILLLGLGYAD
jgi:hypothetical protein